MNFGIVEGYYLMLKDNAIFYVKGVSHPPGSLVALPKYVPSASGERLHVSGLRYTKVAGIEQQFQYVDTMYPNLVVKDAYYCYRPTPMVRLESVKQLYNPVEKAMHILKSGRCSSPVICDVKEFLDIVNEVGGVREVGVSGSVLVDLYTMESDIDVVVYGESNALRMYRFLTEAINDGRLGLRRYDRRYIEKLYEERALETPIPFSTFVNLESRRVLEGLFKNRGYFIRLIREPQRDDVYSTYTCTKIGIIEAKLRIEDDSESIYTPCRYRASVEEIIKGPKAEIEEIYTLRGRFNEIAKKGEIVFARGSLERIEYRNGRIKYRLYLGDPGDYITPFA